MAKNHLARSPFSDMVFLKYQCVFLVDKKTLIKLGHTTLGFSVLYYQSKQQQGKEHDNALKTLNVLYGKL